MVSKSFPFFWLSVYLYDERRYSENTFTSFDKRLCPVPGDIDGRRNQVRDTEVFEIG